MKNTTKALTRNDIFTYFKQVAKEYKKLSNRMPIQVIIVGGASILLNYGFRESTMDIDAFYGHSDVFKQAINNASDKYGYSYNLLNDSFKFTSSFSDKLLTYATYFETFYNVVEVYTIKAEYLIAMKLNSSRDYKYDMSDIIGILAKEKEQGNIITIDKIKQAFIDLYGDWNKVKNESKIFIENELKNDDLSKRYQELFLDEFNFRSGVIKELNDAHVSKDETNIKAFLELARKKRNENK